jgi:hypothetical protein
VIFGREAWAAVFFEPVPCVLKALRELDKINVGEKIAYVVFAVVNCLNGIVWVKSSWRNYH